MRLTLIGIAGGAGPLLNIAPIVIQALSAPGDGNSIVIGEVPPKRQVNSPLLSSAKETLTSAGTGQGKRSRSSTPAHHRAKLPRRGPSRSR